MPVPSSVIYFPYIRVVPAPFMTRLLLYWDDVATIVPDQWAYGSAIDRRRLLGDFTSDLVDEGLVTMAVPTYELEDSLGPFVQHLQQLPPQELAARSNRFRTGEYVLVHKAKLVHADVQPKLEQMNLMANAEDGEVSEAWMWLRVERTTASEFMAVLAQACADQASGIEYWRVEERGGGAEPNADMRLPRVAATNHPDSLLALAEVAPDPDRIQFLQRLEDVRARLLTELFPAPADPVTVEWIVAAKQRFGDLLTDFREAVEREVFNLAVEERGAAHDWNVDLVSSELRNQVNRIEELLVESNIGRVEKVTFALLKAIPGVGGVFGAAQEIAEAAVNNALGHPPIDTRLAYGAFLQHELDAA